MSFSFKEIISAFIVLFAIIDITGSLPIIIDLRSKGAKIGPLKVSLISFAILVAFLFAGEGLLSLFGVDVHSFAVAGAIIMVAKDPNDRASLKIPTVDENRCIGCGACENLCPSRPYSAIHVNGLQVHIKE